MIYLQKENYDSILENLINKDDLLSNTQGLSYIKKFLQVNRNL